MLFKKIILHTRRRHGHDIVLLARPHKVLTTVAMGLMRVCSRRNNHLNMLRPRPHKATVFRCGCKGLDSLAAKCQDHEYANGMRHDHSVLWLLACKVMEMNLKP